MDARRIYPVLFTSGLGNIGADRLLQFITDYLPAASQRSPVEAMPGAGNGSPGQRKVSDNEPVSAFVF